MKIIRFLKQKMEILFILDQAKLLRILCESNMGVLCESNMGVNRNLFLQSNQVINYVTEIKKKLRRQSL